MAVQLVEKYGLEEKFASKLVELAVAKNNKKQAIIFAKKYKVENQFPQLFKTKISLFRNRHYHCHLPNH
ncbi:MAG: hypothetical protein IPN94_27545 [Sphingobacteriales bacterium]|nr:hypothetical protein [Sphingobacteriales bacterium]